MHPALVLRPYAVQELRWETAETFTLVLRPEVEGEILSFLAGQWVYLNLLESDGSVWARAAFSVATAPEESLSGFELAIKIYGDFTKRAGKLMPGDKVGIQGPFGVFVLPPEVERVAMFAGGIGLTPLRSMLRSLAQTRPDVEVTLLYSNRLIEDAAYYEELMKLGEAWPSFHPVFTLTGETPDAWQGEHGRVSVDMIKRHVPIGSDVLYAMCGPLGFMQAVREALVELGINVKTQLKQESFGSHSSS